MEYILNHVVNEKCSCKLNRGKQFVRKWALNTSASIVCSRTRAHTHTHTHWLAVHSLQLKDASLSAVSPSATTAGATATAVTAVIIVEPSDATRVHPGSEIVRSLTDWLAAHVSMICYSYCCNSTGWRWMWNAAAAAAAAFIRRNQPHLDSCISLSIWMRM